MKRTDSILQQFYMSKLPKAQNGLLMSDLLRQGQSEKGRGDMQTYYPEIARMKQKPVMHKAIAEAEQRRKQKLVEELSRRSVANQPTISQARPDYRTKEEKAAQRNQIARAEAMRNSALAQTFGSFTPSGSPDAGAIAAESFVNMNPLFTGPFLSGTRLINQTRGQNPYGFGNGTFSNIMGALGLAGDVANIGFARTMKPGSFTTQPASVRPATAAYRSAPSGSANIASAPALSRITPVETRTVSPTPSFFDGTLNSRSASVNTPASVTIPTNRMSAQPKMMTVTPPDIDSGPASFVSRKVDEPYGNTWDELSKMIDVEVGKGGAFNEGVFSLKDDPNTVVKFENLGRTINTIGWDDYAKYDFVNAMKAFENDPNIGRVTKQLDLGPNIRALFLNRIQGDAIPNLSGPIARRAFQPSNLTDFFKRLQNVTRNNMTFDFTGTNYSFNPKTNKFGLFDISPVVPEDAAKGWNWMNNITKGIHLNNPLDEAARQSSSMAIKNAMFERLRYDYRKNLNNLLQRYSNTPVNQQRLDRFYNRYVDMMEGRLRDADQMLNMNDPSVWYLLGGTKMNNGGPIIDPRGQWAHPGKVTRIPSPNITMQGVPYPVYGVGSNGEEQMMYPGQNYNFGDASYVDEYPMMQKGGQHGGLDRWFAEKWVDVKTGKACGRQEGENRAYPACRPSRRVSSETPKTSSEMSPAEKAKFKRTKTSSERIPYNHKRMQDGGTLPAYQMRGQVMSSADSVRHQADKILKYEQLRGGPGGSPLPYYSDPKYMDMLMNKVYPEVKKIMPGASAMEAAEAMDFIFNAGWDQTTNKVVKDPRAYALQEYYRQYDPSKLDADGKWSGRKNPAYSFDQEYNTTIGKLPENDRRVMMNRGRDWYYKNINNPAPGVPNSNYYDTWYGRIWNTNDFLPFNPNNPNFKPKKK